MECDEGGKDVLSQWSIVTKDKKKAETAIWAQLKLKLYHGARCMAVWLYLAVVGSLEQGEGRRFSSIHGWVWIDGVSE